MGYIGVKGIQYVAKASLYLNMIPFLMILIVFFKTAGGISKYTVPDPQPMLAFTAMIAIVIGFFATAGAAGADFGMNSRNASDVKLGRTGGHRAAGVVCRAVCRCCLWRALRDWIHRSRVGITAL